MDQLAKSKDADMGWEHADEPAAEEPSLFGGPDAYGELPGFDQSGSEESEGEADGFRMISSASGTDSGEDNEQDDRNLEVTGQAISATVSRAGLRESRIFRHRVSGIFHIMAVDESVPNEDGEMSSTKCGKLISHNFLEVDSTESFLPSRCKRCFTQ